MQTRPTPAEKTPLRLGDIEVPCYVLEGGIRVLSGRAMQKALGYQGVSGDWLKKFVSSKQMEGYLTPEIIAGFRKPYKFKNIYSGGSQPMTYEYEATLFIDLCDALMGLKKSRLPEQISTGALWVISAS